MPDWRDAVCSALDFWISQEGGERRSVGLSRIGPARQSGDGWYTLDVRDKRLDLDQVETLQLAGPQEPTGGEGYRVLEAVQDGPLVRVRVAGFVDISDAHLWQRKQPATHLTIKLREGIARLREVGLADELAAGRLAPAPANPRPVAGFTLQQRQALEACLGAGVRLVWGPPGTGKTRVLTEAINELVSAGKRVLLVSSTNIAVDNALLGVVAGRRLGRGVLLRVGTPHHPAMLAHPEVCLQPLVRERLAEVEVERQSIEGRLLQWRRRQERLAHLEETLTTFDYSAYQDVRSRLARQQRVPALGEALNRAVTDRASVESRAARLRAELDAAGQRVGALEGARAAHRRVEALGDELNRARADTDRFTEHALRARADAEQIGADLRRLDTEGLLTRLRNRATRQRLRTALRAADQAATAAEARATQRRELFDRQSGQVGSEIHDLRANAAGTPADIAAADHRLAAARQPVQPAEEDERRAGRLVSDAQQALLAVERDPPITGEERVAAEQADRLRLPARAAERDELRAELAAQAPQLAALHDRYAEVQQIFDRLSTDAEGELISAARVVATTLARMRTNRTVMAGPYDVVLVDEVGAAGLPEVLLAVSRATRAAVLLGDFMQLGAIHPRSVTESRRPDVMRWLTTDVFAHCGIRTPADARGHAGCTALNVQHRFGLEVMGLANAIAYDGLLEAGPQIRPRAVDDPEIVLLDTDDLGDLGFVRSTGRYKGWWPAGALISRVLVDYHQERGERAGVITPYNDQVEATLEALRDQEQPSGAVTEVGTAHRFQGREFPIVVFDLVEDDRAERWMATATLAGRSYQRDGVRLFNVAVTRTQTRLYVIGSRRRIADTAPGSPLAQLNVLLRTNRARVVSGAHLVAPTLMDTGERQGLGLFGAELAEVLARHVQITAIDDEESFYATFAEHLAAAQRSIWLWAPWTKHRVMSLRPLLADARDRGVKTVVFVRDPDDDIQGQGDSRQYLKQLRAVVHSVVAVRDMHQKIVVIDDRLVLLGSLNALSHSRSREVMLTAHGEHFARKLLAHEHADVFAGPPPRCGECDNDQVGLRRVKGKGWQWYCYAHTCPKWRKNGATNWNEPVKFGKR